VCVSEKARKYIAKANTEAPLLPHLRRQNFARKRRQKTPKNNFLFLRLCKERPSKSVKQPLDKENPLMSEPFGLQAVACKVYSVLTENPQARDDDKILLVEIWSKVTKAKDISEFLSELLSGKISFADAVARIRRKLQEKHNPLRGEKWDVRHNLEGAFCQQLTFFDYL
jgi:hypothetical protein